MTLSLRLELEGTDHANLFAGVRKLVGGKVVPFEGPFGFGCDTVAKGWWS